MIQINIEMPKDCNACPFSVHYDSGGAHGFYCSLSNSDEHRWGEANDDGFKFADCPISVVDHKMQVLDKIKGYIDHIRNTGMGKKKSLEFIEKFIEGLKSESGVNE